MGGAHVIEALTPVALNALLGVVVVDSLVDDAIKFEKRMAIAAVLSPPTIQPFSLRVNIERSQWSVSFDTSCG